LRASENGGAAADVVGIPMTDSNLFKQTYANLLNHLAEMPAFLERTTAALPPELLQQVPAEDEFALIEHLWHIRDCDPDLYALRIRKVLLEERPVLEPVDVGAWYGQRRYRERPGDQAIAEFSRLRAELIADLEALEEQALGRVGIRVDGSEVNVLSLVQQISEHDRDHRWRIASILRGFALQT
jgi:hypothetical protein